MRFLPYFLQADSIESLVVYPALLLFPRQENLFILLNVLPSELISNVESQLEKSSYNKK